MFEGKRKKIEWNGMGTVQLFTFVTDKQAGSKGERCIQYVVSSSPGKAKVSKCPFSLS